MRRDGGLKGVMWYLWLDFERLIFCSSKLSECLSWNWTANEFLYEVLVAMSCLHSFDETLHSPWWAPNTLQWLAGFEHVIKTLRLDWIKAVPSGRWSLEGLKEIFPISNSIVVVNLSSLLFSRGCSKIAELQSIWNWGQSSPRQRDWRIVRLKQIFFSLLVLRVRSFSPEWANERVLRISHFASIL